MQDSRPDPVRDQQKPVSRPAWRRPEVSVLDVERGTVTTSGPVSDGNGSTS